jgi:intein/homing endonuclease
MFPFFPFFPPMFPFFPFFPPMFPFFPFFPPMFRCIHEDTLIQTSNGPVAAKDLKVGDKVLSVAISEIDNDVHTPVEFDFGNSLTLGKEGLTETEIVGVAEHLDKTEIVYFNEDSSVKYSNEHPMFIRSGEEYCVRIVKNVKVGDFLLRINEDGTYTEEEILSITNLTENSKVYEFSCSPYKWFIAGGYLVHNGKV